ncbi:phage tail protein I [Pseudomonas sp. 148P]|uniref:Phage tail protein I n=1 Tax=Pseudomonas ulcerans TaxID=3115852 RepID=A0ABU7HV72_9PSED|nr:MULTISPECIES: phage tail protein I [unclassified Pseudomonas]MEE1924288.1 phage tail protein I [Pseudomonas sp. 147P]MEE1935457.1 phage tail protein I [Pseudomonas sp. 148P]
MTSLLPLNSTLLERAVEAAVTEVPEIPLRTLYNPDTCPSHLLHQLALAWSVDRWDENWPDAVKRSVIRSSFQVHARKGTLGALRRVVEPFGYLIEVAEWFNTVPPGVPGTFALKIGVSESGISEETYDELTALIDDARPVSRHLVGLAITLDSNGFLRHGLGLSEGDEIDIYPPASRDIEVRGNLGRKGHDHQIETLDVYS